MGTCSPPPSSSSWIRSTGAEGLRPSPPPCCPVSTGLFGFSSLWCDKILRKTAFFTVQDGEVKEAELRLAGSRHSYMRRGVPRMHAAAQFLRTIQDPRQEHCCPQQSCLPTSVNTIKMLLHRHALRPIIQITQIL